MINNNPKPWSIEDELLVSTLTADGLRLIDDAADLLEVLSMCVMAMKTRIGDLKSHEAYALGRAEFLIEKHKGEQG